MFTCEPEEKELNSQGPYTIPRKGTVSYAGLSGIYQDLRNAAIHNDLSVPLFDNLREGFWLLDYHVNRLKKNENLKNLHEYLETLFGLMKKIPNHVIPRYFAHVVLEITNLVELKALTNIKLPKVKLHTRFLQKLIFSVYEFIGILTKLLIYFSYNCNLLGV